MPTQQQALPPPPPDAGFAPGADPRTNYRFKEPWTVLALDNLRGFALQLACAGGSGAIAKTAVAPLERVKVLRHIRPPGPALTNTL